MPMEKPEDFPLGDTSKDYCVHCSRPDGSMHSYGEQVEALTRFLIKTQGIDEGAARAAAIENLSRMPAWQGHAPGGD